MMRSRWLAWALLAAVTLGWRGAAETAPSSQDAAQDSALALIPGHAPIVVHLRGLEGTKERLLAMIKSALPEVAPLAQAKLAEHMKEALKGRELKGLEKNGPIFVVFTELPEQGQEVPMMAIMARVAKYEAFRDALLTEDERKDLKSDKGGFDVAKIDDKEVFFVNHKGYAVITPHKEVAEVFLKKQPGLDRSLNKDIARKLVESDVGVYVDLGAVNKKFANEIKMGRQFADLGLQQAGGQMEKEQLEMAKTIINGMFQLIEDSRGFLLTGEFRPEGFALHTHILASAESKTNAFLAKAKPEALSGLPSLPADQMGYFAVHTDAELVKLLAPFMLGMVASSDGDDAEKGAKEAIDLLIKAGPQNLIANFSMPIQGLQVWTVKDPQKAVQGQLKLFKSLKAGQNFQNMVLKDKPEVKTNVETHREFQLNSAKLEWDFEKIAEKAPVGGKEMAEVMKKMMGDNVTQWFGTDGKTFIQIAAKDKESALAQLDAYLDGKRTVGHNKAFVDSRKQLPAESTLMVLFDGPFYAQTITEMMGPMFKAAGLPIDIPNFKATKGKSYVGIALTLQPEHGSFDLWIPTSFIKEIGKMVPLPKGADIQ
jgi:hypothetical protein